MSKRTFYYSFHSWIFGFWCHSAMFELLYYHTRVTTSTLQSQIPDSGGTFFQVHSAIKLTVEPFHRILYPVQRSSSSSGVVSVVGHRLSQFSRATFLGRLVGVVHHFPTVCCITVCLLCARVCAEAARLLTVCFHNVE